MTPPPTPPTGPGPDDFDPAAELAFVTRVMRREGEAVREFAKRLDCVTRMVSARNTRMGRPLNAEELADLVQQTYSVILDKLPEFEARSDLEGWIYRICQFEFMNVVRRKQRLAKRERSLEDAGDRADDTPDPAQNDMRDLLRHALDSVGGTEAEIITLKHFEGLTFAEIGKRLDIAVSTIKSRYYAAIRRLSDFLDHGDRRPE